MLFELIQKKIQPEASGPEHAHECSYECSHECSLDELPGGCRGQVCRVCADTAECARLYALGFIPGAELEVKDSGLVKVMGSTLVLDKNLMRKVQCKACRGHKGKKRGGA